MNTNEITSINEIETDAGVLKTLFMMVLLKNCTLFLI